MHGTQALTQRVKVVADRWLGWLLVALMAVAVVNVLWQVFTRFVTGHPSSYTEELARYLLVWIALLGSAYAVGSRMHLAIDLLPARLTGGSRMAADLAIDGCIFLFALLVLVVGGGLLVEVTLRLNQTSPAFGVRIGYVYAALPIAGLIMMLYATLHGIERWTAPREAGPATPAGVDPVVSGERGLRGGGGSDG